MHSKWDQDMRILRIVAEHYEEAGQPIRVHDLHAEIGEEAAEVGGSLRRLDEGGYIVAERPGWGSTMPFAVKKVTAAGLRASGIWPSSEELVERLIAALEEAAARESDPEKSSKLRTIARAGRDLGIGTLAQILGGGFLGVVGS